MDDMTPEGSHEIPLFGHGFVRLDDAMASDLSVVNSARVSFAVRKDEMDDRDAGLIRFLMREKHGTPFEHNSFRFHIRAPIFVAREWMRHRVSCLTGDALVTFVTVNGKASSDLHKTVEELWRMWSKGQRNGHCLRPEEAMLVDELAGEGESFRGIARRTGIGRRAIARHLNEGSNTHRDAKQRVRNMKLRVLNEETNQFEIGHIADIMETGIQPVYRVTLADGRQITATENHRFLTDRGWRTLSDAVGMQGSRALSRMTRECWLTVNGKPVYQDPDWMKEQRERGLSVQEIAIEAGSSYHTIRSWLRKHSLQFSAEERSFSKGHVPWNLGKPGYRLNKTMTDEARAAVRAARSGSKSNFWRGGVSTDRQSIGRWTTEHAQRVHHQFNFVCQVCKENGRRLHAHHIIPVWVDRSKALDIGNLISVCGECHRAIHRSPTTEMRFAAEFAGAYGIARMIHIPSRKGCKLTGHLVRVVAVEYMGLQQTYDVSVAGPWHNLVANGIVVHNSFNEESARYHQLEGEFYVPSPQAVRSQVGKPGSYLYEPADETLAGETIAAFERIYKECYAEYRELIDQGVAKELARALLPFGVFTQFYWTVNARSLMNFLSLRNAPAAQYEIRAYAEAVEKFFAQQMPVTHGCFVDFDRRAP